MLDTNAMEQEVASEHLRVRAEELTAAFVASLHALDAPLRELEGVRLSVAARFPLATQIAPTADLNAVAKRFEETYPGTDRFSDLIRSGQLRAHIAAWIYSVLIGPAPQAVPSVTERRLESVGIVEVS